MDTRRNKFQWQVFEGAKNILARMFPQVPKKAFYIAGFKESGVLSPAMTAVALSAVCETDGDSAILRTYRRPSEESEVRYKVDEVHDVNRPLVRLPRHRDITDHYISHDIPEDMMRRNPMTVEFVSDGSGGLKPNVQPDGMVKVFVNFPDPTEEILGRAKEKWLRPE